MSTQSLAAHGAPTRIDYSETLTGRQKALILVGVLLGLFLAALDQTIVSTAMPRIVAELHGLKQVAWTTTAYLLASTTMVPIYGKLSDLYGRKRIVMFGIVVFLLGSALCGIAGGMTTLILYRAVQGFGAAALTSSAFAVLADLFAPSERARYQGVFGGVFGLSSVIGPYLGGVLTDHVGWRWVFYINLPLGIVALVFIATQMPRLETGVRSKIDVAGALALIVAVVPLLLAITLDKHKYPWRSAQVLGLFALGLAGLGTLIAVERNNPDAIVPFALFRNRTFTLVSASSVALGASFFGVVIFLSLFMVNVLGVNATQAGTSMIPLTLAMVPSAMLSSMLVQRTGHYKVPIVVGTMILIAGIAWMTTMHPGMSLWGVRLRMIVVGIGLGPSMPLMTLAVQNAVPFESVGAATAGRQFFMQLGQAVGAAVFGVILGSSLESRLEANLAPIRAAHPEMAAQFDPSKSNSSGPSEDGSSGDVGQAIEAGIRRGFAEQRALTNRALRDNDLAVRKQMLASPQLHPQMRALLTTVGDRPATEWELTQAQMGLDFGEAAALKTAHEIGAAFRQSFSEAIVSVYKAAVPCALVGLLLLLLLKELALRKTNRTEPAPMME